MYVFTFLERFFHEHVFLALLAKKEGRRNLKMIVFDRKDSPPPKKKISRLLLPKKRKEKRMPFFDQYHRLTPLENMQKCK